MDVLSASYGDDKIAWYENTDGMGTFAHQTVISTQANGAVFVHSSDLDGDGKLDVLSASSLDNKIAWYRNREATKWDELFVEHVVDTNLSVDVSSIHSGDLDGDGDQDVLAALSSLTSINYDSDEISWWENLDLGSGSFYKKTIAEDFEDPYTVYAADLDGDEDIDVLSGKQHGSGISWWENTDADTFTRHVIDDEFLWPRSVCAIDMDDDGDTDVFSASQLGHTIAWFENDGSENFTKKSIAGFSSIRSVYPVDMDSDGDMDMVAFNGREVAWWENDGEEVFTKHEIGENPESGICVIIAFDIDDDEDVDILAANKYEDEIIWWDNDGLQSFTMNTLDTIIGGPNMIYASDLDNDDDLDILAVSSTNGYICMYENLGSKSFYKHFICQDLNEANSLYSADLDNDGDMDIIPTSNSAGGNILWWENRLLFNPDKPVPDIVLEPDTLFFSPGSGDSAAILTIGNIGDATLYVRNISCEAKWISEIDTSNFLVKPDEERVVSVKCSEMMFNGAYESTLHISSNDPVNTVMEIPVVLEVTDGLDVNFIPEIEPNDMESEAQKLSGPSPAGVKGSISVSDDGEIDITWQSDDIEDLFVFTLLSSHLQIYLYDISADLDIALMQIEGNTITMRGHNHRGSAVDEVYEVSDLEPGTYHVGVAIYDPHPIKDNSSYSLVLVGDIYTEIDNTAPVITINSPVEGYTYETNTVPLDWDIEELYFKEAWYSLDNEATTESIEKSGNTTMELENGEYQLTLYAVDNSENESNSSVNFSVNVQATGKALHESQDDVIIIYPNPVFDLVTIQCNSTGKITVEITSINGQLLQEETSDKPVNQMNISSLKKGIYYITVRSEDFITTKKIVKL